MTDKLRVAGVMRNKLQAQRDVIFRNSGYEEFIKLILRLFCLAQRLSIPCDTQKWESVATRLN